MADLSTEGAYDSRYYPGAVAISAGGRVLAGSGNHDGDPAFTFAPGDPGALTSFPAAPGTDLAPGGLAVAPDGSELSAVSTAVYGGSVMLHIFQDPARAASSLALTGPAVGAHDQAVTPAGTLGRPSPCTGGQALPVTRTGPGSPAGVTLPDLTTAANGPFSITGTPPGVPGMDTGTVTCQVPCARTARLPASTASASVTVHYNRS